MTRQISKCVYGGGDSCKRQGGSGEGSHSSGYVHPYPTIREVGQPAGDPVETLNKTERHVGLEGLTEFFDEDLSAAVLSVSLDAAIHAVDVVKKSLYDFDLESDDGVTKLLELLPIMDQQILVDIAGELWPGYPAQDQHAKLLRWEIRGYLIDYLDGHGQDEVEEVPEEGTEEPPGLESPEEGAGEAPDASGAPEAAPGQAGAEAPPEQGTPDAQPAPGPGAEA